MNLRQVLKEYLELDDPSIDGVINEVKDAWSAILAQKLPDKDASFVLEQILGIPDWTKTKPV